MTRTEKKRLFKMPDGYLPLVIFCCIHFIVWSLIPLLRRTLTHDTLEAILWGKLNDWGTNKHPPLSGWLADAFYTIGFGHDIGLYILNQVLILIGFIYIFKLARLFLDVPKATLAVLLLEGVGRYSRTSFEFTNNMVCLALWPMMAYYVYKSVKEEGLKNWIWLGISIGLNLLNKYMSGVLLICMGLYFLAVPQGRKQLKKPGLYIAALIALVIFLPHLVWLYQTNGFSLHYFVGDRLTSENDYGNWGRLIYPARFVLEILLLAVPTIAAFAFIRFKAEKEKKPVRKGDALFLLSMGILPLLLYASIGFYSGNDVKITWGFPLYYMLGILLFYFFPFKLNKRLFKRGMMIAYLLMAAMAVDRVIAFSKSTHYNTSINKSRFLPQMEAIWDEQTGRQPMRYVRGNLLFTGYLTLHGRDKPINIMKTWGFPNPWIDEEDIRSSYILEISKEPTDGYDSFIIEISSLTGKTVPFTVFYKITKGL